MRAQVVLFEGSEPRTLCQNNNHSLPTKDGIAALRAALSYYSRLVCLQTQRPLQWHTSKAENALSKLAHEGITFEPIHAIGASRGVRHSECIGPFTTVDIVTHLETRQSNPRGLEVLKTPYPPPRISADRGSWIQRNPQGPRCLGARIENL